MLSSDLTSDTASLDGSEAVAVVMLRPDGRTQISVAGALRRSVSRSDRSFDGVRLGGDETVWHLPAVAFGLGLEPQPGDTISAGNDVWSITAARREALGTRWRCVCRRRP